MKNFSFDALWTPDGWLERPFIQLDQEGKLLKISQKPLAGPIDERAGFFVPGFQNGHSHAFQYAMAGVAENLNLQHPYDDFWSWREVMYRLALRVNPEQMRAIAALLYAHMLEKGITAVVEFQYLHHDSDGRPYARPTEISESLMAAAEAAGMNLTLVPVYYRNGNFDQPATAQQRRFIFHNAEEYLGFVDELYQLVSKRYPNVLLGNGVHSLRAASQDEVRLIFDRRLNGAPFHIHVAEQTKEVDDCVKAWGVRPGEWLLRELDLDASCHLVHGTHLNEQELAGFARRDVGMVLCPSTEGNLGDGVFPLLRYQELGGRWSIGTDSHVGFSFQEELRWLDYTQRLQARRRNVLCKPGEESGDRLFQMAFQQGRRALGREPDYPIVGEFFDGIWLDADMVTLNGLDRSKLLSRFIYGCDTRAIKGTLSRGCWVATDGQHVGRSRLAKDYSRATQGLSAP